MNCKEALAVLFEVVDKEASEIDVQEFRAHLDACKPCLKNFAIQATFQEFLEAKVQSTEVPGDCLARLKSNVIAELDAIDRESSSRSSTTVTSVSSFNKIITVAASVLLVVLGGFLGNNLYRHQTTYVGIERVHWNAVSAAARLDNEQQTVSSLASTQTTFGYSIAPRVGEFQLVGGELTEVMGVKMSHFLYSHNDAKVSVFVAPASEFSIPDNLYKHPIDTDHGRFYDHHCVGCRLVYHRVGDAIVVTATTERDVELLEFVPGTAVI